MTRKELFDRLHIGTAQRRHWWAWHFRAYDSGLRVPLVDALMDALLAVDAAMPGYASRVADTIVSIAGREREDRDYEQLATSCASSSTAHRYSATT